ncbi:hypothetical protein, partial [Stenotrophomonas maltophilia]|uniref:hypothetical protein n=1 Tax=Stenotrophomonas maltophilia TaxID=40324 RepID=UPI001C654C3C
MPNDAKSWPTTGIGKVRKMNGLSFSSFPIIHAWRGSTVSTKVDTYQEQSAGPDRSQETVEGGVGPLVGVSAAWMSRPSPQGRVYGVP